MQFSQLPPCRPPAGSVGGTVPPPIISPIAGRKARVVIMLTFYHEFMGASDPIKAEDVHSPFLAITVHLQEDFELSSRDHDAAQAVADGLRDAKPPTPAASTKPHGTSSASEPSSPAGNQCPPSPRESPSTSTT